MGQARFGPTRTHHRQLFLLPHLQHLPVIVGVELTRERRAAGGSIFGQEPARLEPDPAGIAEGLGAQRPGTPLGSLLDPAVAAPPRRPGPGLASLPLLGPARPMVGIGAFRGRLSERRGPNPAASSRALAPPRPV